MSSFCQNVDVGFDGEYGGSPGSRSCSFVISSRSFGFAGSDMSYVFRPKRPVTNMTSLSLSLSWPLPLPSDLPGQSQSQSGLPWPLPLSFLPYVMKLMAVEAAASGRLPTNSMFLIAPAGCATCACAGAAETAMAAPSASGAKTFLPLTKPPHRVELLLPARDPS